MTIKTGRNWQDGSTFTYDRLYSLDVQCFGERVTVAVTIGHVKSEGRYCVDLAHSVTGQFICVAPPGLLTCQSHAMRSVLAHRALELIAKTKHIPPATFIKRIKDHGR